MAMSGPRYNQECISIRVVTSKPVLILRGVGGAVAHAACVSEDIHRR